MQRLALLLLASFFISCYPKSRILNWYHSQEAKTDTSVTNKVEVFGFVFPGDPAASKDLWTLTEDAQQAYIEEVGKKVDKPEQLAAAIALPFRKSASSTLTDLSTFKKKIVFTVMHGSAKPADRISNLELRVELPDSCPFSFATWDKITTQYSTVEFGSMSLTGTNTFKLAPEITMAGDVLGTTAGELSRVAALTEEAKLAKRFIEVNGSLSRNEAWLTLNGMPGRDLAGNVVAEVTMKADSTATFALFDIADLFKKDGTPNAPGAVQVGEAWVKVPYSRKKIAAQAFYNVSVRRVLSGDKTIAEGDDNVQLCRAERVPVKAFTVVDGSEFDVKLYYLVHKTTDQHLALANSGPAGMAGPLALRSFEEALSIRKWLQATTHTAMGVNALQWSDGSYATNYAAADVGNIIILEQSLQAEYEGKFFTVE